MAGLVMLQACATVAYPDRRDPIEPFNRAVFGFNDVVDRVLIKPVATVYRDAAPKVVRQGVSNFFGNLVDVWSIFNNAIQFRGQATGDSIARVMVNTTLGLGGLIDVASDLEIERHTSDFGLTLGRWGVPPGPYVVLPILGPYTLREVAAIPIDQQGNLVNQITDDQSRYGLTVLNVVDYRAQYLTAGDVVEGAALDVYSFTRDSYYQRQRNRLYDGNPPEEPDESAETTEPKTKP
jgi:phospholipid-binding lipoprotein MlaA